LLCYYNIEYYKQYIINNLKCFSEGVIMYNRFFNRVMMYFVILTGIAVFNSLFFSASLQAKQGQGRPQQGPAQIGVVSNVQWSADGKFLYYSNQSKNYRVDLKTLEITTIDSLPQIPRAPAAARPPQRPTGGRTISAPTRGHQFMTEASPNGRWYAVCKDWNVWLENDSTGEKIQVTTDGNNKFRYGTANWTYGEELSVRNGMWWSPDSKYLIYYVFSEENVKDFYLIGNLTGTYTTIMSEGYIKAGYPNPIVTMEIYELATKKKTRIDVGEKSRDQYIYNMRFTPDGKELLFNRKDRYHHDLDMLALNYITVKIRKVLSEHQDSWQEDSPRMTFLNDGKRFLWPTEKTMWLNYELRNLDGTLIATLTKGDYPVASIVKVDEDNNWLFFKACSDVHPLCEQLHKVRLDGTGQVKLTSGSVNYSRIYISNDDKYFVAQYETVEQPPSSALYSTEGKLLKVLAEGPKITNNRSELFTFKANDGKTDIYGILDKPADFDPNKTYPLIISVYGGPDSRAVNNTYRNGENTYNPNGYLVAQIDNRGTSGRGKAFSAAEYKKLGDIDIQDQADGARYLAKRAYINPKRIGIVGHSYGGYMGAMAAVKHSDIFTACVDRAGPTDWRNYDSIYTERYMSTPQDNPEGYDNGSAMKFVQNMNCKLLIMHGLIDDNVHPTNAFQFIDALDRAGKKYESRFFPTSMHGFGGNDTQMDFFYRYLMEPYVKK